ncbi:Macrophage mannose receptor 1 [Merluccius polli]|uniref:Macrophage mannose receptor 1 n=1 Tax=Merluccius polli TaxID=89951 RepID=A0AA47MZF4_MERPO|nr:Macrophage mannose receptor 1 [Merluccius polli]
MIENEEENQQVLSAISSPVWIGLYRVPWTWSDGTNADTGGVMSPITVLCGVVLEGGFSDSACNGQFPFICSGVCFSSAGLNKYTLVEVRKTWHDAQEYCRSLHNDLATVKNMDDLNQLTNMTARTWTYIGLNDFNRTSMDLYPNSWRWSTQKRSQTGYMNFAPGQPDYYLGRDECVVITTDGTWNDWDCADRSSDAKTYHYINQALSWESAKSYCRTHHTDLAIIENEEENQQVLSTVMNTYVWIGLYRVPWTWSDGTNYSFRNWWSYEPGGGSQLCGEVYKGGFGDTNCNNLLPFICSVKPSMDTRVLMSLLFSGICFSSAGLNKYILFEVKKTWYDAQEYCKHTYSDLATVKNMDDLNQLTDMTGGAETYIGLNDFNRKSMDLYPNSWRWSTQTRSQTGYMNFAPGQPDYSSGREECVLIGIDGTWSDGACASPNEFSCFSGSSNTKTYHHITQTLSWESAKSYCRTHYTDLAMIENEEENHQVSSTNTTTPVWIGLYRFPWTWSDGTNCSFRHWWSYEPNNSGGSQLCGTVYKGGFSDIGCNKQFPFICSGKQLITD